MLLRCWDRTLKEEWDWHNVSCSLWAVPAEIDNSFEACVWTYILLSCRERLYREERAKHTAARRVVEELEAQREAMRQRLVAMEKQECRPLQESGC